MGQVWSRVASLVVALVMVPAVAGVASAAAPSGAAPAEARPGDVVGNDVSWPQCGEALPAGQAFAIVGVNDGLANTTNPCLSEQLAWAETSTGATSQPKVALYVNTANPAHDGSWWPTSNDYPYVYPSYLATRVDNPYGECTGDADRACAYMYGYAKAYDNATIRGVPEPSSYFWWLDVETMNTWQNDRMANRAVLEGMTDYFLDVLGAPGVGIYSTGYQWAQIVGSLGEVTSPTADPVPSSLNGLPSWLAGATTLDGAVRNCERTPLTGGEVTVSQFVTPDLDYNVACPTAGGSSASGAAESGPSEGDPSGGGPSGGGPSEGGPEPSPELGATPARPGVPEGDARDG